MPEVCQEYVTLYIYNDMTYIYIYIANPSKTCLGTLAQRFDTSTLHGRRMLYITSHWIFAPHTTVPTTHTTLAYSQKSVPTCTFSVQYSQNTLRVKKLLVLQVAGTPRGTAVFSDSLNRPVTLVVL